MDRPVEYEQTDKRWSGVMYSNHDDKTQTIGKAGCGPTCAAMVVATLRDKNVTPREACTYSVAHGFRTYNDGTSWSFFNSYFNNYGINMTQTGDVNAALDAIRKGKMVITTMGKSIWTSGGHFILAYGMDTNGKIKIHDPNSEQYAREYASYANYKNGFRQAWIITEDWMEEEEEMKYYEKLSEVPSYAQEIIGQLVAKSIIQGNGSTGLHLSEDNMKMFVYLHRLGLI